MTYFECFVHNRLIFGFAAKYTLALERQMAAKRQAFRAEYYLWRPRRRLPETIC